MTEPLPDVDQARRCIAGNCDCGSSNLFTGDVAIERNRETGLSRTTRADDRVQMSLGLFFQVDQTVIRYTYPNILALPDNPDGNPVHYMIVGLDPHRGTLLLTRSQPAVLPEFTDLDPDEQAAVAAQDAQDAQDV